VPRAPVDIECDYGELTPELAAADRFGDHQNYRLRTRRGRLRHVLPGDVYSPIKRLGLVLKSWTRNSWGRSEWFDLSINGRQLHVRSYSDHRLRIWLDDEEIYGEHLRTITAEDRREGRRKAMGWRKSYASNWLVEQQAQAEQEIENVRDRLNQRRQQINNNPIAKPE
jgi:hypothetical protein